jgi:hypothetical protein
MARESGKKPDKIRKFSSLTARGKFPSSVRRLAGEINPDEYEPEVGTFRESSERTIRKR